MVVLLIEDRGVTPEKTIEVGWWGFPLSRVTSYLTLITLNNSVCLFRFYYMILPFKDGLTILYVLVRNVKSWFVEAQEVFNLTNLD